MSKLRFPLAVALGLLLALIPPLVGQAVLAPPDVGDPMHKTVTHRRLEPENPHLVVIGNSKAGTDISVPALQDALGRPDLSVAIVSVGSATLPVYYVMLKNFVLPQARPEAIVVYATGIEILTSDLGPDRRSLLVSPWLTDDEPVIARKLYGHSPGGFSGLRERAVRTRDTTLAAFGAAIAGVASGEDGRSALDRSFEQVFGQSWASRARADRNLIPAGIYPSESIIGAQIEDTFVLEIQSLCRDAGVPLVFAVAPVTGIIEEREQRRLRGMEPVLDAARAGADAWIALPHPGPDRANWRDDEHMSPSAAERNSRTLGRELRRLGVVRAE